MGDSEGEDKNIVGEPWYPKGIILILAPELRQVLSKFGDIFIYIGTRIGNVFTSKYVLVGTSK